MIRRDGVDVPNTVRMSDDNPNVRLMNARTQNVSIAKETLQVLKDKRYTAPSGKIVDIAVVLDAAVKDTLLYKGHLPNVVGLSIKPTVEVVNQTTTQAATRLLAQGKTDIAILNFASARNQGGGFLGGAVAQEEDLCRASGLYACLKSKPVFYNENIMCDDAFYTDNILYSPKVPFFRDDHNLFLEEPFSLSVISAPSPNVRGMDAEIAKDENFEEALYGVLLCRAKKILQVAEAHDHKTLILGAWGCGAFGNSPNQVAGAFMEALSKIPVFEHVCFAVYDIRQPPTVYQTFQQVIAVG